MKVQIDQLFIKHDPMHALFRFEREGFLLINVSKNCLNKFRNENNLASKFFLKKFII